MFKWAWLFFVVLNLYNIIYDSVLILGKSGNNGNVSEIEEKESKHVITDTLIRLLSWGGAFVSLFVLAMSRLIPRIVFLLIFTVPYIARQLSEAIKASGSVKPIVLGIVPNSELTIKEKLQFDTMFCGFFAINQFFSIDKLIDLIKLFSRSKLQEEIICSVSITLFVFLFIFFTFVQLIVPLRHLRKGCEFLARKVGKVSKKTALYFWEEWDNPPFTARFTNFVLKKVVRRSRFVGALWIIMVPFAFIGDLVVGIAFSIYAIAIFYCMATVIELIRLLGKIIIGVLNRLSDIPGHNVVKNTFRVSGIIAITTCVIINRFSVVYNTDEAFLGIIEFIASAIIIPVIFEWIYSSSITTMD